MLRETVSPCLCMKPQFKIDGLLLEFLNPNVPDFDLHRRSRVGLNRKDTGALTESGVIVREHAHHVPIDLIRERKVFRRNFVRVPVIDVEFPLEGIPLGEPANLLRLSLSWLDLRFLTSLAENNPAKTFAVENAGVCVGTVKVRLITEHTKRSVRVWIHPTANLHTGVAGAGRAFDVEPEHEVIIFLSLPDEELIVRNSRRTFGCRLSDDHPIFDPPDGGIAFPTGQVLTVEKGNETFRPLLVRHLRK